MKPRRNNIYVDSYYQAHYKIINKVDENSLDVGRVTGQCSAIIRNVVGLTYSHAIEKGRKDALELRRSRS